MASATECNFGSAAVGDIVPLKAPFLDWEVLAKLTRILPSEKEEGVVSHYYELYLFGVYIGMAKATAKGKEVYWEDI